MLTDRDSLLRKLHELRSEHRDLDTVIARLSDGGLDQLQLQRLKKRKLLLKDEVAWLESHLIPGQHRLMDGPKVGVIMGSQSDWATLHHTADTLAALDIAHETRIVSAHRTPDRLAAYAKQAAGRGIAVIIAGAGGAAHLPGMCAAWTTLPVLGVPVESQALKGMDSLLSIVQMPAGIPRGHPGDRSSGRGECGPARRVDPGVVGPSVGRPPCRLPGRANRRRRRAAGGLMDGPLPPNATIGIVGGGQLGRMSAMAAARLGYRCHILTPETDSPASQVSARTFQGDYEDPALLRAFAESVDVITFEFENVSAEGLELLQSIRPVRPSPAILRISQDRCAEKGFPERCRHRHRVLGCHPQPGGPARLRGAGRAARPAENDPRGDMMAKGRRRCAACRT